MVLKETGLVRNQNESDMALNATGDGPTGAKLPRDSGRGWRWHGQRHRSLTGVGNKKEKNIDKPEQIKG